MDFKICIKKMVLTGSVDIKWIRERLKIKKEKEILCVIFLDKENS